MYASKMHIFHIHTPPMQSTVYKNLPARLTRIKSCITNEYLSIFIKVLETNRIYVTVTIHFTTSVNSSQERKQVQVKCYSTRISTINTFTRQIILIS